jgi:putative NIF3 family GTP cyclohydrolase 1 type 2
VDAFLTGEVGHHDARRAQDLGLNVVDLGHYGTEVTFGPIVAAYLRKSLRGSGVQVHVSRKIRPPWRTVQA